MDAIILVGGKGTRLQEVISHCPKPLAPIRGRPFLDLLIEKTLSSPIVNNVILATGYLASQIVERYKGKERILISHEEIPLGTGGAIKQALSHTQSNTLLIMNGDSYLEFDLESFYLFHQNKKGEMTFCTRKVEDVSRYGSIQIDKEDRICAFSEKKEGGPGLINGGVYLMQRSVMDCVPSGKSISLEQELFPTLLNKALFSYSVSGYFIDIGTKESYFQAQEELCPKNMS